MQKCLIHLPSCPEGEANEFPSPLGGKRGERLTKQTRQPLHYVVNKCYLRNNNFQDNIIFSPDKPNTMEFVCYTFVYDLCYITAGQRFFNRGAFCSQVVPQDISDTKATNV